MPDAHLAEKIFLAIDSHARSISQFPMWMVFPAYGRTTNLGHSSDRFRTTALAPEADTVHILGARPVMTQAGS